MTWDRRDDPLNPRSGRILTADLKYAFPFLAADANFLKALLQAPSTRPYGVTRFVFSFRGGVIWNYQPCDRRAARTRPSAPPNLIVPVPERLFAGGSSTHRAFARDNLGIAGETSERGRRRRGRQR